MTFMHCYTGFIGLLLLIIPFSFNCIKRTLVACFDHIRMFITKPSEAVSLIVNNKYQKHQPVAKDLAYYKTTNAVFNEVI
jgi:hypothetical protein